MSQPQPGVTINYDDAVMAANVAGQVKQEQEAGVIDRTYLKGIPAIWKYAQFILSFIAYLINELTPVCSANSATFGFFSFVTLTAFACTVILWLMLLLKVPQRCLRCDCVNWPFAVFCFYCGLIIFYFFANLFLAIHACLAGHSAACFFGFAAMFVYMAETVFMFRLWWKARKESSQPPAASELGSPVESNKY